MKSIRIGILLVERDSGRQVGVVELRPSGVLGFHVLQAGLHVFALKPVERVLNQTVLPEPLYRKYAVQLGRKGRLGSADLKREAQRGAHALNRAQPTLVIGNKAVRARAVEYRDTT